MNCEHPSNSRVQQQAEKCILEAIEAKLGLESGTLKPKRLLLEHAYVEMDGFSIENNIICEVYAHIGKLKSAQAYKVINDAMKMLLIEKIMGIQYRKIIAVCDSDLETQLRNTSWKALALSKNNIEIIKVDIIKSDMEKIAEAQKGSIDEFNKHNFLITSAYASTK